MTIDYSWAPPGYDTTTERRFFFTVLPVSALWSLIYFDHFRNAEASLYEWIGETKVLKAGASMPDFYTLLEYVFVGFAILAVGMLALMVARYNYHHRGSKAVYLMKRLPNRYELHRRCLVQPLLAIGAGVILAAILLLLYYRHYLTATPAEVLTPHQWQKIWGIGR